MGAVVALDRPVAPAFQNSGGHMALLEFMSVGLDIGNRSLIAGLSLSIREGEVVCIVGPSGCGKTTTLRLLAGLIAPTTGEVRFRGEPITRPRQDVAIVFQDYGKALLPWRNAVGNVALAFEAMSVPKSEHAPRVADLLAKTGLAAHADKYPGQMSGGMQQRLQIARALAQSPSVLLMDEPFGALDAMTRQSLQDELLSLSRSTGVTVFFVTHDLEEAIYLADRVVALQPNPGRVGRIFDVTLPRPRDQMTTREHPEFLRLRRHIFSYVQECEG